jgi:predicted DNA binding CopG/RHH family protein
MENKTATTRISMILPRGQLAALKRQAEREKRPYSNIIREALEAYLGVPDTVQLGGIRDHDDNEATR